jgi:zinc protease
MFSEISAFTMESFDPGLFVVTGKLSEGVTMEAADEAIQAELKKIAIADKVTKR